MEETRGGAVAFQKFYDTKELMANDRAGRNSDDLCLLLHGLVQAKKDHSL
jgi:hypothetical protein